MYTLWGWGAPSVMSPTGQEPAPGKQGGLSEVWGSQCVHYRGPRNVGLCRDTKVGAGVIPDSASRKSPCLTLRGQSLYRAALGKAGVGVKVSSGKQLQPPLLVRMTSRKRQTNL